MKARGNLTGLKSAAARQIDRLFDRHGGQSDFVDVSLATAIQDASIACGRRIAVTIDRKGSVFDVVIGDAVSIELPRGMMRRVAPGRLNGFRLVVTTFGDGLGREDIEIMRLFSFDAVVAVIVGNAGNVPLVQPAWPIGPGSGESFCEILPPAYPGRFIHSFCETVRVVEATLRRAAADNLSLRGGTKARDAAIVVIPCFSRDSDVEWEKSELESLCSTAGIVVLETVVQKRAEPDPRFVTGAGKLREVTLKCLNLAADLIIFGVRLSPSQQRAISAEVGVRVIDRNQLILDIFARNAASVEGRLEVELAQLRYNLPRLSEKDDAMSRLTGGPGALGPGETKLEMERRRARERINLLQRRIEEERGRRSLRRRKRRLGSVPLVAIAGYTNAGKSTLFNTLTGADVTARDKLFATLDPTVRSTWLPAGFDCLMVDTVGFIRDLPAELQGAFAATLEEIAEADVILQVADASDPHVMVQIDSVGRVLEDFGHGSIPRVLALNKADRITEPTKIASLVAETAGIPVCALKKESLARLLESVAEAVAGGQSRGT